MRILGLSALDRDAAACLLEEGDMRAAAQEERFSRKQHQGGFPIASIAYCMEKGRLESASEIDIIACDEGSFRSGCVGNALRQVLPEFGGRFQGFSAHRSQEASASIPSPLREAAVASGNAGSALGAAMAAWRLLSVQPRPPGQNDAMQSAAVGPAYTSAEIREFLDRFDLPYELLRPLDVPPMIAELVADGNLVGLLHGGMEFGPGTLGSRSILGDPRGRETKTRISVTRQDRVPSTPCANVVPRERAEDWLKGHSGASYLPVDEGVHSLLHAILSAFEGATGVPALINAPFSCEDEPIVCSPIDAYRCMMRTQLDCIVMEDVLVWRREQPAHVAHHSTEPMAASTRKSNPNS